MFACFCAALPGRRGVQTVELCAESVLSLLLQQGSIDTSCSSRRLMQLRGQIASTFPFVADKRFACWLLLFQPFCSILAEFCSVFCWFVVVLVFLFCFVFSCLFLFFKAS